VQIAADDAAGADEAIGAADVQQAGSDDDGGAQDDMDEDAPAAPGLFDDPGVSSSCWVMHCDGAYAWRPCHAMPCMAHA
jgi:hypothetical protein